MDTNDLSKIPDSVFTNTNTNTGNAGLLNKSNPLNPNSWIAPEIVHLATNAPAPNIEENVKGLEIYDKYNRALFSDINAANANSKVEPPLGKRYFGTIGKKCFDDKGQTIVDQYYVIDGMAAKSGGGGLINNAAGVLDNIDSNNISGFYNRMGEDIVLKTAGDLENDSCVKVDLVTDKNGNKAANFVSKAEAAKLISSGVATEAFHTQQHIPHHPRPHHTNIVYGYDGQTSDFGGYVIGADILSRTGSMDTLYFVPQTIESSQNSSMYSSYASIVDPDNEDYVRAQKWLRENGAEIMARANASATPSHTNGGGKYDTITGFFLGSVTVLGLFIVFRFLDIRTAIKMGRQ